MRNKITKKCIKKKNTIRFLLLFKSKKNKSCGKKIGIDKKTDELWVKKDIDLNDSKIIDFLESNFKNPINTLNFIKRGLKKYFPYKPIDPAEVILSNGMCAGGLYYM